LTLTLPAGIEADGEWTGPAAVRSADGQMIYEGTSLEFRRRLRVADRAAGGQLDLSCELGYQACDRSTCRLPTTVHLKARGEVVSSTARTPTSSGPPIPRPRGRG
jgi:hypothetical protein